MKKTLAAAAFLLLASTAAQAQYQFEYGGRTIRIDPDRGTVSDSRRLRQYRQEIEGEEAGRGQERSGPAASGSARSGPRNAPETAAAPAAPAPAAAPPAASPPPAPATAAVAPADTGAAPLPPPVLHDPAPPPRRRLRWPLSRRPHLPRQRPLRHQQRRSRSRRLLLPPPSPRRVIPTHRWRLADRGEGRQGPHRTMRRQSLRLFGRCEIERQWRAGADQHAAGRRPQMERPDPRSQHRQHL